MAESNIIMAQRLSLRESLRLAAIWSGCRLPRSPGIARNDINFSMRFIYSDIKRYFKLSYFKILIILTSAIWLVVYAYPKQNSFEIIYCQAGQGDATLIQQGFRQLLIDSGPGTGALDCLERHVPFFDRTIEMTIITHPQSDHAAGLIPILERYQLISFVYNGVAPSDPPAGGFWSKLSVQIIAKNIKTTIVSAGDKIQFGKAELEVLWPEAGNIAIIPRVAEESSESANDTNIHIARNSLDPSSKTRQDDTASKILGVQSSRDTNLDALVLRLNYDQFSALFTSDIDSSIEASLLNNLTMQQFNNGLDVLKVAHHGSKFSSSLKFLSAIRPSLSIIEVGKNSYGHPTKEALDRLTQIGSKILRTDQDGDVVILTNGQNWSYKTSSF